MRHTLARPRRQNGITLITALIFLVVMTLIGLSSVRLITQQERAAQYSYDRGLAFQAAEAALRQAETSIEKMAIKPTRDPGDCGLIEDSGQQIQLCPPPTSATPRWTDTTFTGWRAGVVVGTSTLAVTPQYFIEYLGDSFPCDFANPDSAAACKRYRITAKAGGNGRAHAMVQSIYATD
jgi:type IV pilus assembly protein PilX